MRIIEENVILGIPVLCCYTVSKEPTPLVLLSHWFSGDKAVWEDKLEQLAEAGYYVVALDNRLHGERERDDYQTVAFCDGKLDLLAVRKAIKETADDVQCLLDYFTQTENVQAERIGMLGVSMGGFITFAPDLLRSSVRSAIWRAEIMVCNCCDCSAAGR